jgi:hypothetical protein
MAIAPPVPAAAAPRVQVEVVGRSGVLAAPGRVRAGAAHVRVGRRRCAVGAGTPLAALLALRGRPALGLRDYGSCSSRPSDSTGLYVRRIGADRARGRNGWVYKVGNRAPSIGAADPAARLRAGDRLLWFYCRMGRGGCQRSLVVSVAHRVALGGRVTARVRGYDDRARSVPVAGAVVHIAGASFRTAASGSVTFNAPAEPGSYEVHATARGLVRSFPEVVRVG